MYSLDDPVGIHIQAKTLNITFSFTGFSNVKLDQTINGSLIKAFYKLTKTSRITSGSREDSVFEPAKLVTARRFLSFEDAGL